MPETTQVRPSAAAPLLLGLLLVFPVAHATEPRSEKSEADQAFELFDINEGELRFLTEPPRQAPHVHQTQIVINADSLETGWIQARQCHYNLDRVPALQVVFHPERVRNLRILDAENIERAWIEGPTVQVEKIGKDAVLCIASENRSLRRGVDGGYVWRGGPYMRRFFDGYFPMHVKLTITYPYTMIQLRSITPPPLKLKAIDNPGIVQIDTLFEGRLEIELGFSSDGTRPGLGW